MLAKSHNSGLGPEVICMIYSLLIYRSNSKLAIFVFLVVVTETYKIFIAN